MGFTLYNSTGAAQLNSAADLPVGTISQTVLSVAPAGWLMCDGNAVSRTAYAELFAAIGTTYGHGDGSTTFNVPDFRGRVPVGAGTGQAARNTATPLTGTGKLVPATPLSTRGLGEWGGQELHQLTVASMPSHTHNTFYEITGTAGANQARITSAGATLPTSGAGGDNQHNNMQPFLVVNYIILATSLSKRVATSMPPQYVTALPGNPVDGQEVYFVADSTNGVIWHLRYNASSTSSYKWEFIGGPSLFNQGDGNETQTTSTAWAGTGPSITAPLAGEYEVSYHSGYYNTAAADYGWTSIAVGGSTAASNTDTAIAQAFATHKWVFMARTVKKTITSSSTAIQMRHQVSSGTGNFGYRSIKALPMRVG